MVKGKKQLANTEPVMRSRALKAQAGESVTGSVSLSLGDLAQKFLYFYVLRGAI